MTRYSLVQRKAILAVVNIFSAYRKYHRSYFDSKPGVGPSVVSLIDGEFERQTMDQMATKLIGALGYDCPTYSTYLNVTYGQGENFHSRPNAICEFGNLWISEHADKFRLVRI